MREGQKTKQARHLRQTANTPERRAWNALRGLRRSGHAVRRQHPIGHYIVDFAIVGERLAIEVDGGIHRLPEVAAGDQLRQEAIEEMGWRVLRFIPEEATSPDHLLTKVFAELDAPSPPAPLSQAGEGRARP